MKKRILSMLTAFCIAASIFFGGAIPASAVTTRVMTVKFEIYQNSTKVAETSFAPSNDLNDYGYDYARQWNVTLQGGTEYKLVVSWGTPLYEGWGEVSAQVVDMYAGKTFTDITEVKSLNISQLTGMNTLSQHGSASCVIKSNGYGVYPMHIALDKGDGGTTNKFKINLTFQTSGKEGDASSTVPQGSNVNLIAATNYSENYYNFSWTKNGTPIDGANGKTYTAPQATAGDVYVATISRKPNGTGCTGSESWTHTFTVSSETFGGPTVIDGLIYDGTIQKLFNDGIAPTGFDVYYYRPLDVPGLRIGHPYDTFWNEKESSWVPEYYAGNAGTYTIYYFIANSAMYGYSFVEGVEFQCLKEGELTCTIAKANPTLNTVPTAVTGLEYNGQPQNLVTAGTATNGTMQYRVNGGVWSDTVPTAINAGSYTVEYRVKGANNNYNTLENANYKLTVNVAAEQDASLFDAALAQTEYEYTGSAIESSVTVAFGNRILADTEYSVSYENNINAGTAAALITSPNWSGTITKTFTINPKQLTNLQLTNTDKIFDGSAKATDAYITFDGVAGQDDIDISADIVYSDANAGTNKTVTASNLQLIGAQSGNYVLNTDTVISTGTVSPMAVTVTAADKDKTYGEVEPELTWTASPAAIAGNPFNSISISRAAGENAGTYAITIGQTEGANPNYDITFENGVFTINPKEISINWGPAGNLAYTGSSLVPAATATNLESGDECVMTTAVVETADGAGIIPGIWTAKITSLSNTNYKLPDDEAKSKVTFEIINASQDDIPTAAAFPETIDGKADGRITGVNSTMEYRKDSTSDYTAVSGTEINGLEEGIYYIRYAAKQYTDPSADQTVVVYAGRMLDVTIPSVQEGYTLTTDRAEASWNDSATLSFALASGYSKTTDFAVKINGTSVTLDSNDEYTITDIQEDKTITVEGVADITAPVASIKVDGKEWTVLQDTVTQQHFYNTAQTVTVTAADVNLDKVYYHIADTAVAAADITDWTEYTDSLSVDTSGDHIVYVKATDTAGNVIYINSDIIVYDDTAPVISGITDGATVYVTTCITAIDENPLSLQIGTGLSAGGSLSFTEGVKQGTINGNCTETYTVTATDAAGNKTELTVYAKPISTLSAAIADLTTENVTTGYEAVIKSVKATLGAVSTTDATDSEKQELAQAIANCDKLLATIEGIYAKRAEDEYNAFVSAVVGAQQGTTRNNYKLSDKAGLEATAASLQQIISDNRSSAEQKATAQAELNRINAVIKDIKTVESAISRYNLAVTNQKNLPEADVPGDKSAVEYAVEAMQQFSKLNSRQQNLFGADRLANLEKMYSNAIDFDITHGHDSEYMTETAGTLEFKANGHFDLFSGVKIDSQLIDIKNYTAKAGSTVVTLTNEYLQTLSEGIHTIKIVYNVLDEIHETEEAEFTVKAAQITDDITDTVTPQAPAQETSFPILLIIIAIAAILIIIILVKRKREDEE